MTNYKGLTVVNSPVGDLGQALTNNFTTLADRIGVCNYTAITDPGITNDSTQGYSTGSRWLNTVSASEFVCVSAGVGAAVWNASARSGFSGYSGFSGSPGLTGATGQTGVSGTSGYSGWSP